MIKGEWYIDAVEVDGGTTNQIGAILPNYVDGNGVYKVYMLENGLLRGEYYTYDTLNYFDIGMNREYWVVYTGENGCSVESDRIDNPIVISDVSIEENEADLAIKLYPNPTLSMLNVEFEDRLDQMTVLSLDGKVVKSFGLGIDVRYGKKFNNL